MAKRRSSRKSLRSVRPTRTTQPRSKRGHSNQRHWLNPLRWWKFWLPLVLAGAVGVVYLDHLVREKFEGKKWALPARVYAQPLELYAGLLLRRQELIDELRALGYQTAPYAQRPGQMSLESGQVRAQTRGFAFWDQDEPATTFAAEFNGSSLVALKDGRGNPLDIVRLEPQEIGGIYPAHMEDRMLVRLQDIPPLLGEALIAVEDRHFLDHHGVSPRGIARAAWANLRSGSVVQGGSTLTQQLVKNFYLNQERRFTRKLVEAVMALSLDYHYSKSEILETYINEVYLGQSGARAIHGFALGSQYYFRQPLAELRIHQIALLVGLVKGASYYNPWNHPERALERRNLVLTVLRDEELISEFDYRLARKQGLDIVDNTPTNIYSYPAFIELVKRQLQREYQEEDLRNEGLRIFTTLSPRLQASAERALSERLQRLEQDFQVEDNTLQGAVVVTGVGSGEILAVVGDRDRSYAGFNRALDSRRPIGSLVKPAVYLTALAQPERYTLVTQVDDAPVTITTDTGKLWQPQNFSRESHGMVPLYQALAQSYNQASARLGMELGLDEVIDTLHQLGVEGDIRELPALLLGTLELSPMEVNNLYQTIATEGVATPQRAIRAVLDADGEPLSRYPLEPETRFASQPVHLLQFAMKQAMREGTGKTIYQLLPKNLTVAGKTGTTNDQRDSWFAGFTGDHLAVVWVGRDDNGPTPLTGATGAMRVWGDLMAGLSTRSLDQPPPPKVSYHWVDPVTGGLSSENCQDSVRIPFVAGSEPDLESRCRRVKTRFPWFRTSD